MPNRSSEIAQFTLTGSLGAQYYLAVVLPFLCFVYVDILASTVGCQLETVELRNSRWLVGLCCVALRILFRIDFVSDAAHCRFAALL